MIALVGKVPRHIDKCELTYVERALIAYERAVSQHEAYKNSLKQAGFEVVEIEVDEVSPDAVFVEDPAIVLDELAIITPMGAGARRSEPPAVAAALENYRSVTWIESGSLEGGDVLRIGRRLFVGRSSRTDHVGITELTRVAGRFDYEIIPADVTGCLHLKTGVTAINDTAVLINRAWVDAAPFKNFELIDVPLAEPWAANVLRLPHEVLIHSGHAQTKSILEKRGINVGCVDISEFMKTEAGLTCLSLIMSSPL